jgi:hypothetical protein
MMMTEAAKDIFLEVKPNGEVLCHRLTPDIDFVWDRNDVILGPFTDIEAYMLLRKAEDNPSVLIQKRPLKHTETAKVVFVSGDSITGLVLSNQCCGCGDVMADGIGYCTTCSGNHGCIGRRRYLGSDDNPWRSMAVRALEDHRSGAE